MTAIFTVAITILTGLLTGALGLVYSANGRARRSARAAAHSKKGHLQAEQQLTEERRAFLATLEASQHGVLITDPDNRIVLINSLFAGYLGIERTERLVGQGVASLVRLARRRVENPESLAGLMSISNDETVHIELQTRGDQERSFLLESSPIAADGDVKTGRLTLVRDRTRLLETQRELRQARALETIATLAGGVAHDFNNKLTTILGNTRQVRELAAQREAEWRNRLEGPASTPQPSNEKPTSRLENPGVEHALDELENAAQYCADLTKGLLTFSSQAPVELEDLPVYELVSRSKKVLTRDHPDRIDLTIVTDFEEPPGMEPTVRCAPQEVQHILANLVDNARRAIEDRGSISVVVAPHADDHREGKWIRFTVADDGPGMEVDVQERVFDPFFTTRPVGQGTGLGLSIAHGLVRAQNGWIEVESRPGAGTRCSFFLPAGNPKQPPSNSIPTVRRRSDLILVADDEAPLRRLIRLALEQGGYKVLEAVDGEQAVELFNNHSDEIAMAILDLSMPKLDGMQVIDALHKTDPGLPIILSSGHFGDRPPPQDNGVAILPKPYSANKLVELVRANVLAQTSRTEVATNGPELAN
jgi:signal transduction histidine kinase/CheY-like chemotaxis protein